MCSCTFSLSKSFCSPLHAAPSAPVNVMAVIVEGAPGNVSISWFPPSEPNGIIVHYDIMCTSAQRRNVSDRRVGSMAMNYSISLTGLTPATRYACTVTASTSAEGPPGMDDVLTCKHSHCQDTLYYTCILCVCHT